MGCLLRSILTHSSRGSSRRWASVEAAPLDKLDAPLLLAFADFATDFFLIAPLLRKELISFSASFTHSARRCWLFKKSSSDWLLAEARDGSFNGKAPSRYKIPSGAIDFRNYPLATALRGVE
jgi:hypothetical protein